MSDIIGDTSCPQCVVSNFGNIALSLYLSVWFLILETALSLYLAFRSVLLGKRVWESALMLLRQWAYERSRGVNENYKTTKCSCAWGF